jgi:hypothetical protein
MRDNFLFEKTDRTPENEVSDTELSGEKVIHKNLWW